MSQSAVVSMKRKRRKRATKPQSARVMFGMAHSVKATRKIGDVKPAIRVSWKRQMKKMWKRFQRKRLVMNLRRMFQR